MRYSHSHTLTSLLAANKSLQIYRMLRLLKHHILLSHITMSPLCFCHQKLNEPHFTVRATTSAHQARCFVPFSGTLQKIIIMGWSKRNISSCPSNLIHEFSFGRECSRPLETDSNGGSLVSEPYIKMEIYSERLNALRTAFVSHPLADN